MKTHFNNPEYAKKMAQKMQSLATCLPPAILFEKNEKKSEKKDNEKEKYKTFDIKLSKKEKDSEKVEISVKVFENGTPEDFCKWYEQYVELAEMMPLDTPTKKIKIIRSILKDTYLETFNNFILEVEEGDKENDEEDGPREPTDDDVEEALEAVTLKVFKNDHHAYRRQVRYMRYQLYFTNTNFQTFFPRLKQLNKYLKFFPIPPQKGTVTPLTEDDLIEIIDNAKPLEYNQYMLQNNYDPYDKTLEAFSQYIERLETSVKFNQKMASTANKPIKKRKRTQTNEDEEEVKGLHKCKYCKKMVTHEANDCWEKPGNEHKKPRKFRRSTGYKTKAGSKKTPPTFTAEQLNFLIQNAQVAAGNKTKNKPTKKRKVTYKQESDSDDQEEANMMQNFPKLHLDSDELTDNSEEVEEYFSTTIARTRTNKRRKKSHFTTEVVGEIVNRDGKITPIRCLLDTGTTASIILKPFANNVSRFKNSKTKWITMGGVFETRRKAQIEFKLPEFTHNKTVKWITHVDEITDPTKTQYDLIIGSDLMRELNIVIDYRQQHIVWDDVAVSMKQKGVVADPEMTQTIYEMTKESSILKMSEERHNEIIKAMYGKVDIREHVKTFKHLTTEQQQQLAKVLEAYPDMYEGSIGTLNIDPVHFELKPKAVPFHAKPFPIPKAYENLTKEECKRFERDTIWHHTLNSVWAAPSFIVPKKTGDVRVVTDFRELNKWIVRKPYPIPKILDILQKMERFKYATAVDLRKGYYHIPLDKATQKLCTTILPWGKYSYERLPMGIATSPDIFQKAMNDIFGDLDYVLVYLDDILILSNDQDTFEDHLKKVQVVFSRLHKMGMKVNLLKTEFFKDELEYLGYLLTPHGIKPLPKKVEAISRILPPKTKRQLRRFLGMVNYYRDMWKRRSHILSPLSKLVSKSVKWKWTAIEQTAFDEAKRMIQKETMLAYPKFGETFHIYADASNTQLGGVIMQNNKPLAFYTRKLNSAQSNYSVGEKELLSLVETLKSFENILMGQKLVVHTDHLNLLYKKLASARLVRWRMLLEEFGPEVKHIQGEKNVVADALSRLDLTKQQYDEIVDTKTPSQLSYANQTDISEILEELFPMSPQEIKCHQQKDEKLQKDLEEKHDYFIKKVEGQDLIMYRDRIYVPATLKKRVMDWYHTYLLHPGSTRMISTIQSTMHWHGMRRDIEHFVKTCDICQRCKKQKKKYGLLPPKKAETTPWKRVNVDLIGPYTIQTKKRKYELRAMTMIDPVTNWFEIARIINPSSEECQRAFDSTWIARYPRPKEIGFDNGSEFKALFMDLCDNMSLKRKPTTDYNPQSNAIIERIHQVLGNQLRTFELENRELTKTEKTFEPFLTACAYALRCTYHTTLKATPGQLVFGRDMILPIKFEADWALIEKRKQMSINNSNRQENKKRIPHTYAVGDKVLLTKPGILRKMSTPYSGPYIVQHVFSNGTINIQKGAVIQRVNIRRVVPYHE